MSHVDLLTPTQRLAAHALLLKYGVELPDGTWIMRSSFDHEATERQRRLVTKLFDEERYSIPDE